MKKSLSSEKLILIHESKVNAVIFPASQGKPMTQEGNKLYFKSERHARLIEQASVALNRFGVSHTSLTQIARSLKLSREALYYYVNDKEDLIFQCYLNSCNILVGSLEQALAEHQNAYDVLDAFVLGVMSQGQTEPAALSELHCLKPDQRLVISGICLELKQRLVDVIERGIADDQLRPCSPGVAALAVLGMISWLSAAQRWRSNDGLSREDIISATREIFSTGIAAKRSPDFEYHKFAVQAPSMPVERIFDSNSLAAARRNAILAAASWLFNLKGFGATSLDEVAERIGVTKKVIYHNVGNKETLLMACYRRAFGFYESIVEQLSGLQSQPLSFICHAALCYTEAGMCEEVSPLVSVAGLDALPDEVKDEINRSSVRLMDAYLDIFELGQATNVLREFHPRAVIAAHAGLSQWMPKWRDLLTEQERDLVPSEVAEIIRIGLRPL